MPDKELSSRFDMAHILYYIGGAVVFLGIVILVGENWATLDFLTKVLATLGAGIAAYITGLLLTRDSRTKTAGSAFYLISAMITPIGLYVVLDHAGFDAGSYGSQSMISGLLCAMYLASYALLRKNIFTVFGIIFGTWFFFSFTSFLIGGAPYYIDWKFYEYRLLAAGLAYILLGYAFSKDERAPLSGFLYGLGIVGFLGAALALGGWNPNQNAFWELIFPGLVSGALFLSVYLKSKAFLTWGTLFLFGYIMKITAEYFSSGLGWPLALVLAGIAMIAAGGLSLSLKKKYLAQ